MNVGTDNAINDFDEEGIATPEGVAIPVPPPRITVCTTNAKQERVRQRGGRGRGKQLWTAKQDRKQIDDAMKNSYQIGAEEEDRMNRRGQRRRRRSERSPGNRDTAEHLTLAGVPGV